MQAPSGSVPCRSDVGTGVFGLTKSFHFKVLRVFVVVTLTCPSVPEKQPARQYSSARLPTICPSSCATVDQGLPNVTSRRFPRRQPPPLASFNTRTTKSHPGTFS